MVEFHVTILILSGLIILTASILKGITGFGFALLAVPFLSLMYPMQELVPAMSLFNLFTSLLILFQLQVKIKGYYFVPMFFASLAGLPLGILALEYVSDTVLRLITGLFVLYFSLRMWKGIHLAKKHREKPVFMAGFWSGLLTSSISVGGPPLVIAMNRKGYSKEMFRGIFAWFSVFSSLFTAAAFSVKGLMDHTSLFIAIVFLPLLIIGTRWGNKLALKIQPAPFRKLVISINIITGLCIFLTALLRLS